MSQQANKQKLDYLDLEFKKLLCGIRQQIPNINSNAYLMQCRLWLEKLSGFNTNKKFRNIYLTELSKQIQANKLLPPFNEAPPRGELNMLFKNIQGANFFQNKLGLTRSPFSQKVANIQESQNCLFPNNSNDWDYIETAQSDEYLSKNIEIERNNSLLLSHGEPANNQDKTESLILNATKSKDTCTDDDSWSDVTDVSSGIEPQSAENEHVKNDSSKNQLQNDAHSSSCQADDTTNYIQNEPNLKLSNDTNYISEDWKKTIAALQLRLSEMIQQNNELNAIIQKLETHKGANNRMQNAAVINNLHNNKINEFKKIQDKGLLQLEAPIGTKLNNLSKTYDEKLKSVSSDYERQIAELKKQNEDIVIKKDNEICRLSEIIQDQCLRILNDISTLKTQISNCTCEKKVHVLKKCVSKIDKLFQKSESEYIKQIEYLKQELEIKESALQVQLKLQKAELIAQTKSGQKEEFEQILNDLEVKYIKMLEGHEHQVMKMKKLDDERIQYLTQLLEANGIPCNDNFKYNNNQ